MPIDQAVLEERLAEQKRTLDALTTRVMQVAEDLAFYKRAIPLVGILVAGFLGYQVWDISKHIEDELRRTGIQEAKVAAAFVKQFAADLQRVDAGSGCSTLGNVLTCWGRSAVPAHKRNDTNLDVVDFHFTFSRAFAEPPVVTTGLLPAGTDTGGHGCTWAIYSTEPSATTFSGGAILLTAAPSLDRTKCVNTPVVVSYLAIGRAS